jgi:hypothetical protein
MLPQSRPPFFFLAATWRAAPARFGERQPEFHLLQVLDWCRGTGHDQETYLIVKELGGQSIVFFIRNGHS